MNYDSKEVSKAILYLESKERQRRYKMYTVLYLLGLIAISMFFVSCAPVKETTPCGEPNQYQCVNLCDGLYSKTQGAWVRYYKTELDCNVEQNQVFERYL